MPVMVFSSNEELGARAAEDLGAILAPIIAERGLASVVLATGNSMLSLMQALRELDIAWNKVVVFHMDEYLGMSERHPASFPRYIREKLTDIVRPRAFFPMRGDAPDVYQEIERYTDLMRQYPPDVTVLGIGENGHLAFNDPPADFDTEEPYLVVNLDEACRRQQLGEGWFPTFDDVPTQAISMSIRQIMKSAAIICTVPDARKAQAVKGAVEGPVTNLHPSSILQRHPRCGLFLDEPAASLLSR
jgi:glucosamine-6-phosphate deaminase